MNTEVTCSGIWVLMTAVLMGIIKLNIEPLFNISLIFLVGFVSIAVIAVGLAGEENE